MKDTNVEEKIKAVKKNVKSCIWRKSGAVSAETCESRPDDCEGCPVYTALAKVSSHKQVKFFNRDYFDMCSVNACAVPGRPCPFAGPCMANWSRTNAPALRTLTLMGIGGLSIGANASLIQQLSRRNGLYTDLLARVYELRNKGALGPDDRLSPANLDLKSVDEQFAMVATASFLDCLELLDLGAFAETMFEENLMQYGLANAVSAERSWDELWNAFRALQGLAVMDVLSAFDINLLIELQATIESSRYSSLLMAQMALTVQRVIEPHTHRPPALAPDTIERAVTLVSFAGGLLGKVFNGMMVTHSELAAAIGVARVLGAVPAEGAESAGRVLLNEILHKCEAGTLDLVRAQPILSGIVASGLVPEPDERSTIARAVRQSFQESFKALGDMRADPVTLLACMGSDNLVRESKQFEALANVEVPVVELDPELLGCEMPPDRFYHHGHAWVQPARDGSVRVGLDDLAAHLVGKVDAVELPETGEKLQRGKPALRLIRGDESVEVYAPMDGEVVAVNQSIADSPAVVPSRPYGDGWLLAMRPSVSESGLSGLMFGHNALEWLREEAQRLTSMFRGRVATAADGAALAHDALAGIPGVSWSKVLRKFLKV